MCIKCSIYKLGFEYFLSPVKLMEPQAALPCDISLDLIKMKVIKTRYRLSLMFMPFLSHLKQILLAYITARLIIQNQVI